MSVNGTRLLDQLDRLRAVGATEDGGVSRPAFSDVDVRGRDLVADYMRAAGLRVRVDPAANLIGTHVGRRPELGALVLGSHVDTVPDGGAYDGAYGVLAAVEVMRTLREHDVTLDRTVLVVAFSNEEGTAGTPAMFGSRAVAGQVDPAELALSTSAGRPLAGLVDGAGGDSARLDQATWPAGFAARYLELHIEQGPVLEQEGRSIGLVAGISARCTVEVVVRGHSNHSGTTPMSGRQDALLAAAHVVLAVWRLAAEYGLVRVATTGDCSVRPGAWNVIPGEVRLVVDLRDLSARAIDDALRRLRTDSAEIAAATGTSIEVTSLQYVPPIPCDPGSRRLIEQIVHDLGLSYLTMPSGAGHDAQWIAGLAPIGMIFVPSRDGVSHAPHERTDPTDLVNGAEVLLGCTLAEGTVA